MQGIPAVNIASTAASTAAKAATNANQSAFRQLASTETGGAGTTNAFAHLLQQTNNDQKLSDQAIADFVAQKPEASVQSVVMAVAEAEMSFQFFMEVRNRLIDSYNELMRMQF